MCREGVINTNDYSSLCLSVHLLDRAEVITGLLVMLASESMKRALQLALAP
jgi:hypothetical protein